MRDPPYGRCSDWAYFAYFHLSKLILFVNCYDISISNMEEKHHSNLNGSSRALVREDQKRRDEKKLEQMLLHGISSGSSACFAMKHKLAAKNPITAPIITAKISPIMCSISSDAGTSLCLSVDCLERLRRQVLERVCRIGPVQQLHGAVLALH